MNEFWADKRVLITGHTGFKGSWLSLLLTKHNAQVFGFSLPPDTTPAIFTQLGMENDVDHVVGDIRDAETLQRRMDHIKPDVIFHLAAQPLVLTSYEEPVRTWGTNVMGSVNLLNALRNVDTPCAVVMVTTDKVYRNDELGRPYSENDTLGGHDPYSASKAAMELVVQSFRDSLLNQNDALRVASVRAGNVIGGGDWSQHRIVPDIIRALQSGQTISLRNPNALRPWQHVLDPLVGYMKLAELLMSKDHQKFQSAYNFGPDPADIKTVKDLVLAALKYWPGDWTDNGSADAPHETHLLSLANDKAKAMLGVHPVWAFDDAVEKTILWYKDVNNGASPRDVSLAQLDAYLYAQADT